MAQARQLAAASVAVALAVLALKGAAAWITGSVALFADALESVVNVAAAGAALVAVRYAAKPPDANHPYGHAKAEYFSAVLEGGLIVAMAVVIVFEAASALRNPVVPDLTPLAVATALLATAANASWAAILRRRGRALRSPALIADARHLMADVVTSVGVLVGIGLAATTGLGWLDPVCAVLTAANIVWSGLRLMQDSVGGLMDEAVPDALLTRIREAIAAQGAGAIEAHDVRSRHAGRLTFVEFHLVVPGAMPVAEAHAICDRIEAAIRDTVADVLITIHVEPEDKAKHRGVLVL